MLRSSKAMGNSVSEFPHKRLGLKYAPSQHVSVEKLTGNRLLGYAVPELDPRPAAVILAVGERVLDVAVASRFSAKAKADGLRNGWCGFELGSLQKALALGPYCEIRCAVTRRTFVKIDENTIASATSIPRIDVTIEIILDQIRKEAGTVDSDEVWPFVELFIKEKGIEAFLEASYRYFLGRSIDNYGRTSIMADIAAGRSLRGVWDIIKLSDEARAKNLRVYSGPFDPNFPFSLESNRK